MKVLFFCSVFYFCLTLLSSVFAATEAFQDPDLVTTVNTDTHFPNEIVETLDGKKVRFKKVSQLTQIVFEKVLVNRENRESVDLNLNLPEGVVGFNVSIFQDKEEGESSLNSSTYISYLENTATKEVFIQSDPKLLKSYQCEDKNSLFKNLEVLFRYKKEDEFENVKGREMWGAMISKISKNPILFSPYRNISHFQIPNNQNSFSGVRPGLWKLRVAQELVEPERIISLEEKQKRIYPEFVKVVVLVKSWASEFRETINYEKEEWISQDSQLYGRWNAHLHISKSSEFLEEYKNAQKGFVPPAGVSEELVESMKKAYLASLSEKEKDGELKSEKIKLSGVKQFFYRHHMLMNITKEWEVLPAESDSANNVSRPIWDVKNEDQSLNLFVRNRSNRDKRNADTLLGCTVSPFMNPVDQYGGVSVFYEPTQLDRAIDIMSASIVHETLHAFGLLHTSHDSITDTSSSQHFLYGDQGRQKRVNIMNLEGMDLSSELTPEQKEVVFRHPGLVLYKIIK